MKKTLEDELFDFLLSKRAWTRLYLRPAIELNVRRDAHVVLASIHVCGKKMCDVNSYAKTGNRKKAKLVGDGVNNALKKWAVKTKKQSEALVAYL